MAHMPRKFNPSPLISLGGLIALLLLWGLFSPSLGATEGNQTNSYGASPRSRQGAQTQSQSSSLTAGTYDLAGWAWSSNIGWISMSSATEKSSQGYGAKLQYDGSGGGSFSGYAWSPNVGWLRFDPPVKDPQSNIFLVTESPTVSTKMQNNALTGWARFCAGTASGDCTGPSRADGWDGWLKLSSVGSQNGVAYGVSFDPVAKTFSGYAWGGPVVGWVSFDSAHLAGVGTITDWIAANNLRATSSAPLSFPAQTPITISWGSAFDSVVGPGTCDITNAPSSPKLHSSDLSGSGSIGAPPSTPQNGQPYQYTISCGAANDPHYASTPKTSSVSFIVQQQNQNTQNQNPPANPGPQPPKPPVPSYHEL